MPVNQRFARMLAVASLSALLVAACGKTGGSPVVAGVYHLAKSDESTSLELRRDGSFTLRRESCASIGDLECGRWQPDAAGTAHLVTREGLYWPTPDDFPSTVLRTLTFHEHDGELVVVGESPWAGTFTQRWSRGRTCEICGDRGSKERPCAEPLPSCTTL